MIYQLPIICKQTVLCSTFLFDPFDVVCRQGKYYIVQNSKAAQVIDAAKHDAPIDVATVLQHYSTAKHPSQTRPLDSGLCKLQQALHQFLPETEEPRASGVMFHNSISSIADGVVNMNKERESALALKKADEAIADGQLDDALEDTLDDTAGMRTQSAAATSGQRKQPAAVLKEETNCKQPAAACSSKKPAAAAAAAASGQRKQPAAAAADDEVANYDEISGDEDDEDDAATLRQSMPIHHDLRVLNDVCVLLKMCECWSVTAFFVRNQWKFLLYRKDSDGYAIAQHFLCVTLHCVPSVATAPVLAYVSNLHLGDRSLSNVHSVLRRSHVRSSCDYDSVPPFRPKRASILGP